MRCGSRAVWLTGGSNRAVLEIQTNLRATCLHSKVPLYHTPRPWKCCMVDVELQAAASSFDVLVPKTRLADINKADENTVG